ncbi:MAG: Prepilin-type N-terminal cleavage/methylation protein [Thermodesulfobacteriota bacterium]|nr:Prepilin-type N-terminal cleavage/methylation protein [Thermodesulfobacteriota bacterium]
MVSDLKALLGVRPETIFGHMQVFNSEIGNFGQAQRNQGIAWRRTHSTSHKKSRRLIQRSPKRAVTGWKLFIYSAAENYLAFF